MLFRKILVAVAAGALITTFSLATISPADAAKKKRTKVARVAVAPAPAPNPLNCAVGLVFFPIKILMKQPIC